MLGNITIHNKTIYLEEAKILPINYDIENDLTYEIFKFNIDEINTVNYAVKTELYKDLIPYIVKYISSKESYKNKLVDIVITSEEKSKNIKILNKDIYIKLNSYGKSLFALNDVLLHKIGLMHDSLDGSDISSYVMANSVYLIITVIGRHDPEYEIETSNSVNKINEEETFKEDECIICFKRKSNVLFCICGHLCICSECRKNLKNNKCPMCNADKQIIRII